ncbi:hypothetical protein Hanom_Chr05g00472351 [Helianthus anomalus]
MKRVCCCSLLLLVVHLSLLGEPLMVFAFDPTQGFTNVPLTSSSFIYQKPYNVPLKERYSFKKGIHRFWVYANDKPFERGSNTQPRTEAQIKVSLIKVLTNKCLFAYDMHCYLLTCNTQVSCYHIVKILYSYQRFFVLTRYYEWSKTCIVYFDGTSVQCMSCDNIKNSIPKTIEHLNIIF